MATLEVTNEQLRLIQQALDMYSRIGIGQLWVIKDHPTYYNVLHNKLRPKKEIEVGDETVKVAQSALKVIQQNVQEYRLSNDKNPEDVNYLLGLIEKGSKMVGYSIKEYADKLTGSYTGSDISLKYK